MINTGVGGDFFPGIFYIGAFCFAVLFLGFPFWAYFEMEKLHRSFHILREDFSDLESDIQGTKDKITLLLHTESLQNKIQLLKGDATTMATEIHALEEQINALLTQNSKEQIKE